MKKRNWMVLGVLLVAGMMLLSGCSLFGGGSDNGNGNGDQVPEQPTLSIFTPDPSPLERYRDGDEWEEWEARWIYMMAEDFFGGFEEDMDLLEEEGDYTDGVWSWTDDNLQVTVEEVGGNYKWTFIDTEYDEEIVFTAEDKKGTKGEISGRVEVELEFNGETETGEINGSWSESHIEFEIKVDGELVHSISFVEDGDRTEFEMVMVEDGQIMKISGWWDEEGNYEIEEEWDEF